MLIPILQNAALLILGGVALYAILTRNNRIPNPVRQKISIGLALGAAGFLVTISPIIGPNDAALDARAGPTLIAGFLGGPLGALVAATMGAIARSVVGGTFAFSGVIVFYVYGMIGVLLGAIMHESREPWVSKRSILLLCVGSLFGAALMFFIISPREIALSWLALDYPFIAFANVVSVVFLSLVCRFAIKRANESQHLRSTLERLDLATTAARTGIWEYDLLTHEASWDARMHEIYETTPENFKGEFTSWLDNVHPEDRDSLVASFESLVKNGQATVSEFRAVMGDGRTKTISAHVAVLRSNDGQPVRMIGANQDISDLRESENREQSANRKYFAIAQSVPGTVFQLVKSSTGEPRFEYLSDNFNELCALSISSVTRDSKLFWNLADEADARRLQEAMELSERSMTPWISRWKVISGLDETRWFEIRAVPEPQDGKGTIWNGILFDVTEEEAERLAKAEKDEKAFKSQRMEAIGKLTGGIAHDFNNLLAVIVGNTEFIRDELSEKPQIEFADAILGAAGRSAELIKKMLSFAGQARLEPETLNLNDKIKETTSWIARTLPANLEIDLQFSTGAEPVRADAASVESAYLNLILNARDAMPNGGKINVQTRLVEITGWSPESSSLRLLPGNYTVLSVIDEGCGIKPDCLERVFEPFFSTKAPGTDTGSGLGLSMVHGFLKQTGGSVNIESTIGVGTKVSLYFPASPKDDRIENDLPLQHETVERKLRVLIAEDEPAVARIMQKNLIREGHKVIVGQSGDEAAKIFDDQGPFDLVISDIVMPGDLQGPDLVEKLRQKQSDLPAIFISGYADSIATGRVDKSDLRLMKPVSRGDLAVAIKKVTIKMEKTFS